MAVLPLNSVAQSAISTGRIPPIPVQQACERLNETSCKEQNKGSTGAKAAKLEGGGQLTGTARGRAK